MLPRLGEERWKAFGCDSSDDRWINQKSKEDTRLDRDFVCSSSVPTGPVRDPDFSSFGEGSPRRNSGRLLFYAGCGASVDPDFGVEMKWDIPLLDGYRWLALPNYSLSRHAGSFFTYVNPQIWRSIHSDDFDAVVLHTGYVCATFWIAMLAAKWSRLAVLLSTDAHSLSARDHKKWKVWIKKLLWPCLFGLADVRDRTIEWRGYFDEFSRYSRESSTDSLPC